MKLLSNAGLKISCVITLEPLIMWISLDIALYYGNRNLISNYGSVTEGYIWLEIIPCGIICEDIRLRTMIPILKNPLAPLKKSFDGYYNRCLLISYVSIGQAYLY